MKKKKAITAAVCVVLAAGLIGGKMYLDKTKAPVGFPVETMALEPMTLTNNVSLTGVVETGEGRKVYSTLSYPITKVNVEVGDIVSKGDVLCQLDSESLSYDIKQQEVSLEVSRKQMDHAIELSEKAYENAKNDYENDLNSQILSAESSVKSARAAVSDAKENLRIAKDQADGNVDDAREALRRAEAALSEANANYNQASASIPTTVAQVEAEFAKTEADYQEASRLHELDIQDANDAIEKAQEDLAFAEAELRNAHESDSDYSDKEAAVERANESVRQAQQAKKQLIEKFSLTRTSYEVAKSQKEQAIAAIQSQASAAASGVASAQGGVNSAASAYDAAWDAAHGSNFSQMEQSIDSARRNTENAEQMKDAAHNAAQEQIESARDNIVTSQLQAESLRAQEVTLEKLKSTMKDTVVTAPISGMVTAVYAKTGQPGNGLMFVIEDTDSLKVKTKVKEYDLSSIQEGMTATIKSDATGDKEIPGTVTYISPVAVKSADGNIQTGTNVEFETEIDVTEQNTGLRIGMNTRLNVLLEQKDNVFGVPYDAVVTMPDGSSAIYVAELNAEGSYVAKSMPVTTGMESDFYIEISGEGIKDGLRILSNPAMITEGMILTPDFAAAMTVGDSGQAAAGQDAAVDQDAPAGAVASTAMVG